MRILVLSNFYPPHFIGGYELACRDMVHALTARGHEVRVLTSSYGVTGRRQDGTVCRWLMTNLDWNVENFPRYLWKLVTRELVNQRAFRTMCEPFHPDVVYAWNLSGVSLSACLDAERRALPVSYFVFDGWLAEPTRDPWCALIDHRPRRTFRRLGWRLAQAILQRAGLLPRSSELDLRHAQFASRYLKKTALKSGRPVAGAKVIYWGLDLEQYPYKPAPSRGARLLYVGQLAPHKGLHTAIEALQLLRREVAGATLTVVGDSTFSDYKAELDRMIARLQLKRHVIFMGRLPREDVTSLYADHDVLIFPSVWDEPFGITLLEAMASGIPVVATATGGAAEILEEHENALVFSRGDAAGCAGCIGRLLTNPELYERLRTGGRRTVERRFVLERTVDEVEIDLETLAGHAGADRQPGGLLP